MPEFRRILLPTDFSERAEAARSYAVMLAEKFGAELHVLHVLQEPIAVLDSPKGDYRTERPPGARSGVALRRQPSPRAR